MVADDRAFQIELGKLEAEWTALRAGVRECAGALCDAIIAEADDVPALTAQLRSICAFATERCLEIGGRAMRAAGAGAVLETNVIQRVYRDLAVSAQHVMVSDAAYVGGGLAAIG